MVDSARELFEKDWYAIKGHEDEQPKVPVDWSWDKRCAYWVWLRVSTHNLALWTQAQEQMREKAAHRFLEMKKARKGLDYRDYPGEDLNGIKLDDAISEIRALPLDPLPVHSEPVQGEPAGEGQEVKK